MKKRFIFSTVFVLIFLAQSWFLYLTIRYPFLGINLKQNENKEWTVYSIDRVDNSSSLDIHVGDIIAKINNLVPDDYHTVQKWQIIEQADTIEIFRNGETINLSTNILSDSLKYDLLIPIVETLCFIAAILLLLKIRNSRSAQFLALVFVVTGITFMSLAGSMRGDATGKLLITNSLITIPIVFLHFLIVLYNEKGGLSYKEHYFKYLYFIVLVGVFVRISFYYDSKISFLIYRSSSSLSLLLFLVGIILVFAFLLNVYLQNRTKNSYIRTITKFVCGSLFLSFFPIIFFSFIPHIIYGKEFINSLYTSWFVLILPLAFAYLIGTKQLYDIDMAFRRIGFTIMLASAPGILVIAAAYLLFPHQPSPKNYILLFFVILLIFTFFLYSTENIYTRMERFMFPRKHILQAALKKIAKDLTSTSSFRELKDLILVDIVNTLEVYGGAIAFKYRDSIEIISEGEIDESEVEAMVQRELPCDHPDFICIEINKHEEHTSFLVMTHKRSNTLLVLEEVQWLGLIVSYLAVSLENVYLIRKLTDKMNRMSSQSMSDQDTQDMSWFRKLTFELQERERMRIAADMHDTTMQDLFHLKRKIAALGDKHALPAEAKENVRSLVEFVEIINVTLRQNCFDLHPYLLQEIGFIRTVEKIVERESYACPFAIRFEATGAYAIERQQLETKRHLFRIVQELLNNARKHSEASIVSLRLSMSNGSFHLHYRDDGVGFEPERLQAMSDIRTSGVGMEQLRSRILHMHGHLELEAHKGEGVRMNISFPMKEGISA